MRWSEFFSNLDDYPIRFYKVENSNLLIRNIQSSFVGTSLPLENTLYLGRYSDVKGKALPTTKNSGVFLFLDEKDADLTILESFCNIATIDNLLIFNECADTFFRMFSEEQFLAIHYEYIQDGILSNQPLQSIVNAIATMFQHHVRILDNSLSIVCSCENYPAMVAELEHDEGKRYIKPYIIDYLHKEGQFQKMLSSQFPFYVNDEPHDVFGYISPIITEKSIVQGYLSIFTKKEERLSYTQLLYHKKVSSLLSFEFQKKTNAFTGRSAYITQLLNELLTSPMPNIIHLEQKMSIFGYTLLPWRRIIVVQPNTYFHNEMTAYQTADALKTVFGNVCYTIQQSEIVFLFSSREELISEQEKIKWEAYVAANDLQIGISCAFDKIQYAGNFYKQARNILQLGKEYEPEKQTHWNHDLNILNIVSHLSAIAPIQTFTYPPLYRLYERDPDLAHTLYVYLKNNKNIAETCKELFIQRSTFYYRLDKLKKELHCDFSDSEIIAQIIFTFKILIHLKCLP